MNNENRQIQALFSEKFSPFLCKFSLTRVCPSEMSLFLHLFRVCFGTFGESGSALNCFVMQAAEWYILIIARSIQEV